MTLTTVFRGALAALVMAAGLAAQGAQAAEAAPPIVPAGKDAKGYAIGDMALGKADAPVTVIEYASMTCPHCAAFEAEALPKLKSQYIETGKLRLIFREFPLDRLALEAAKVARCAGPDRYFAFVEVLFAQQGNWARAKDPMADLQRLAKLGGIGEEAFKACVADQALADQIVESRYTAEKAFTISGTPGFVLDGKSIDVTKIMDAIDEAVKKADGKS